jgi:hypothetical protein
MCSYMHSAFSVSIIVVYRKVYSRMNQAGTETATFT